MDLDTMPLLASSQSFPAGSSSFPRRRGSRWFDAYTGIRGSRLRGNDALKCSGKFPFPGQAILGIAATLFSQTACAAEAAPAFGDLFKLVFALALTIALFVLMAFVMKKLQLGTGGGSRLITVLAALPLGGKEKLYLLEVGGEQLLVGSSPGHVSCVHVLRNPVNPVTESQRQPASALNFSEVLRALKQGKGE